jgi:8-hydroxy-5-deazaflavin:NADPH oxidoreductase
MDIAIVGAGNVGRALAASSVRAGHIVTLSSRSQEDAQLLAKETGARAATSNVEAVQAADVAILAIPYSALEACLGELGDALEGKIVVDVTNRVNPNDPAQAIDGTSAAEQIQSRFPAARVVKAFNTAFASRQADPVVDGTPIEGFVAGDDEDAKRVVLALAGSIGFRPVDAGPLGMARVLEAMAALLIWLQIRNNWSWQNGWKLVGPTG